MQVFAFLISRDMVATAPHVSAFARLAVLVQPSSAASERVFSHLAIMFPDTRNSSLQDLIEGSVMARMHFIARKKK